MLICSMACTKGIYIYIYSAEVWWYLGNKRLEELNLKFVQRKVHTMFVSSSEEHCQCLNFEVLHISA